MPCIHIVQKIKIKGSTIFQECNWRYMEDDLNDKLGSFTAWISECQIRHTGIWNVSGSRFGCFFEDIKDVMSTNWMKRDYHHHHHHHHSHPCWSRLGLFPLDVPYRIHHLPLMWSLLGNNQLLIFPANIEYQEEKEEKEEKGERCQIFVNGILISPLPPLRLNHHQHQHQKQ